MTDITDPKVIKQLVEIDHATTLAGQKGEVVNAEITVLNDKFRRAAMREDGKKMDEIRAEVHAAIDRQYDLAAEIGRHTGKAYRLCGKNLPE